MNKEITKIYMEELVHAQEEIMKKAISHKLGRDWTLEEVIGRVEFRTAINKPGERVFLFDKEELVVFFALEFEQALLPFSGKINVSFKYLELYLQEKST